MEKNKLSIKKQKTQKTFEKNNLTIALNSLHVKEKELCPAYISKVNLNCEKQVTLLIIPDEEKEGQHYFAVKNHIRY